MSRIKKAWAVFVLIAVAIALAIFSACKPAAPSSDAVRLAKETLQAEAQATIVFQTAVAEAAQQIAGATKPPEGKSATPVPTAKSSATLPAKTPTPIKLPTISGVKNEYFPLEIGVRWAYEIQIGEAEPLNYKETRWPMEPGKVSVFSTRGRYTAYLKDPSKKSYRLTIAVKGPAEKQGGLQYPIGAELEIEEDELGIFGDAEKVFFAVTTSGRYMAQLVATYPPDSLGAPFGMTSFEDGFSMQILFFTGNLGTEIGIGKEPKDKLALIGLDTSVPKYKGEALLHFRREVAPDENILQQAEYLNNGFTEDLWFAKGKGLVRLEQKVNGKVSMVWVLTQFTLPVKGKSG